MDSSPLRFTFGKRYDAYLGSPQDYHKYRRKLNRSLHKLRAYTKIQTKDTKNYSKKQKQTKLSASDFAKDAKFGNILLVNAERDAIYALEIRAMLSVADSLDKKVVLSQQNHITTKLKKALKHCHQLLEVAENVDQNIKLELYAYMLIIESFYKLQRHKWADACHSFSMARLILQSQDIQLFRDIINDSIDPNLKVVANKVAGNTQDLDIFTRQYVQQSDKHNEVLQLLPADILDHDTVTGDQMLSQVDWRGHTASVSNEQLATLLFHCEQSNDLALWQQALELYEENLPVEPTENDQILATYIKFNLYMTMIERDNLLIQQQLNGKLQDKITTLNKLLDNMANTVDLLKDVPGVYSDDELYAGLEGLVIYCKAYKNMLMGRMYASKGKSSEALALFENSYEAFKSITVELPIVSGLAETTAQLVEEKTRIHIVVQLNQRQGMKGYLSDNLNVFPTGTAEQVVARILPLTRVKQVAPKPTLFDLAYNYLEEDDDEDVEVVETVEVSQSQQETQPEKKKGLFGFF